MSAKAGAPKIVTIQISGQGLHNTVFPMLSTDDTAHQGQKPDTSANSKWTYKDLPNGKYVFQCFLNADAGSNLSIGATGSGGANVQQGANGVFLRGDNSSGVIQGAAYCHFTVS